MDAKEFTNQSKSEIKKNCLIIFFFSDIIQAIPIPKVSQGQQSLNAGVYGFKNYRF